jgi:hypothetical protein
MNCCGKCWQPVFFFPIILSFAALFLVLLILAGTYFPGIDLVHRNVAVGEANGTLSLGTLGYCLDVNSNKTCVVDKDIIGPYIIGQSKYLLSKPNYFFIFYFFQS